jgi:chromosome segregation ATPase
MAPESMRKAINTSHSNLKNMLTTLDALEQQLDADGGNEKSVINTSRSNIKSQRTTISELEQTLDDLQVQEKPAAMNQLDQKTAAMNMQFLALQRSLAEMGKQYNTISNVLKTRHESAMASIRNMK